MTVKKVGDKWFVVKNGGQLGKRGFSKKSSAEAAQARGRALAGGATSASRKPSSRSSGGGSMAGSSSKKAPGIGVTYRRFRLGANISAGAWGPIAQPSTLPLEDKVSEAVRRYAGVDPRSGVIDAGPVIENAKGIGVSLVNDYVDRKLGNASRLTRGKLAQVLVEGLPWLRARLDHGRRPHPFYGTAVNWNKRVTGYDAQNGGFILGRIEEYAVTKAVAGAWDKLAPKSWKAAINGALPTGLNPA